MTKIKKDALDFTLYPLTDDQKHIKDLEKKIDELFGLFGDFTARQKVLIEHIHQLEIELLRWKMPANDHCHADRDGDCTWVGCPQLRDGEPAKTGRHCPLDKSGDEEI